MYVIPTRYNIQEILSRVKFRNGIPKILHQIWYAKIPGPPGEYVGPDKYKQRMTHFSVHNPGWLHILWTNDTIDWLIQLPQNHIFREIFDQMVHAIQKADIIRMVIGYMFGGVYADLDFHFVNSFDTMLDDFTEEEAVFFMEHRKGRKSWFAIECINTSCFISKPGATILADIVKDIGKGISDNNVETEVVFLTGPRRVHAYLYGPPRNRVRPKWKVREFDGNNNCRVHVRSAEYLLNYASFTTFPHNLADHSGWADDIVMRHIHYYGVRIFALVILILAILCAILYFFSPYTGIWKKRLYGKDIEEKYIPAKDFYHTNLNRYKIF